MGILVKLVLVTFFWLALFEPHLIQPLAVLPIAAVLQVLTMPDYLTWVVTFVALELIERLFVRFGRRRGPPLVPTHETRPVMKRGDWNQKRGGG